jgi:hypothetical protein
MCVSERETWVAMIAYKEETRRRMAKLYITGIIDDVIALICDMYACECVCVCERERV